MICKIKLDGGKDTLDMLTRLDRLRRELLDDYLAYKNQINRRICGLQQIKAEKVAQNEPQVNNQARVLNEGIGNEAVNQLEVKINLDVLASS